MTKIQSLTMMGISSVVLVIGVLLASGSLTSAQSPTPTPSATDGTSGGTFHSNGCGGLHIVKEAAASVLGLTNDELRTELRSGKSLAEVAQAHGMSVDDFKTVLVTKATTVLKAKLDAGELTQAQYDSITSDLQSNLDAIVNEHHTTPSGTPDGGTRFYRPFGNADLGSGA